MKGEKRLPDLRSTGRQYLDQTRGARLAGPGLERFVREKSRVPRLIGAGLLVVALIALMIWLSSGR